MRKSGPMVAEVSWGRFTVELCGGSAKVWVGEGLPEFDGPIEGIEPTYPDLWAHLLKIQAIKRVE